MSFLDGLLGQVAGNVDIKNLAERVGISPEQAEQAVQALGAAHTEPGDTAATAAANTGLPADTMREIIAHLGGEGALAQVSALLQGGEGGGMLGKLGGLASGFLNRSE